MAIEYVVVQEHVRGVVNGVVVVRRRGARITRELAVSLGIVESNVAPSQIRTPARRPRKPAGATKPKAGK